MYEGELSRGGFILTGVLSSGDPWILSCGVILKLVKPLPPLLAGGMYKEHQKA